MFILVLIGVYLVFKVTTSYEKLHQDNTRSTERYVILREVIKLYKILEIVVISTQRDNQKRIISKASIFLSRLFYCRERKISRDVLKSASAYFICEKIKNM